MRLSQKVYCIEPFIKNQEITRFMSNTNLDANTLAHFEQMADQWWDVEGVCKPLHAINPVRLAFILKQLDSISGHTVLDVGCGAGLLSEALARQQAQVVGIDPSEALIQVARKHAKAQNLSIQYIATETEAFLQKSSEKFSIVSCMEILEHVPNPGQLIHNCSQLTQPGGHLFFSTINRTIKAWLMTILGAEYLLGWLPTNTHHYKDFIRPAELAAVAREAGLSLICCQGVQYRVLSGAWTLSPSVNVNYIMHFQKTYDVE
jgi:2-polyprenyl-6-hydroxyphenyl methylase / 3-demethylubiquinone-9 3-methyltransferase